jgi:hypothetical protein
MDVATSRRQDPYTTFSVLEAQCSFGLVRIRFSVTRLVLHSGGQRFEHEGQVKRKQAAGHITLGR